MSGYENGSRRRVVSGSSDGEVRLWNVDGLAPLRVLLGTEHELEPVASVAAAKPTMSSVLADKSACAYAALMKARLAIIEEPKTMTQTTIIATVTANVVDLRTLILAHFILKVATVRGVISRWRTSAFLGRCSQDMGLRCGNSAKNRARLLFSSSRTRLRRRPYR